MTTETQIKREIVVYLDSLGEDCWHVAYHNMGYGRRGVPDRIVCYRGRFLAFEIKRLPGERRANPKAEAWQDREIAAIMGASGKAFVVWSVDHVKNVIKHVDREIKEARPVAR